PIISTSGSNSDSVSHVETTSVFYSVVFTDFSRKTNKPTSDNSIVTLRKPTESAEMALRTFHARMLSFNIPILLTNKPMRNCKFSVKNCMVNRNESRKLVLEVKEKLERDHFSLPVGKNGRDDEGMIFWFLEDRKFSVDDAIAKLIKAIKWRQEFRVSELSEESVKGIAETGKAYVHDFLDVNDRPVLIVVACKHFPVLHDPLENEKLCVFLIEKALRKLPSGKREILGIIDLRGFRTENADMKFLRFMFDVLYYYYPKRVGLVLFVEAPFIFKPIWQLTKPLLKSYASMARFCSVETVRKEYFTEATLPVSFRD
ncbi:CRAL_TRIO domain-containing protein, partial [Cephalotus follicularis]